jgi:Ni,Fe-hydrogenase III small subunit
MKNLILTVLLFITAMPISHAEDKIYPLDIKVRVYPQEIRYGDACFLIGSVTNKGQETLYLPYGKTFLRWERCQLHYGDNELLFWHNEDYNRREGTMPVENTQYNFPGCPVKPGKTMEFHVRLAWLPLPEFASRQQAKELQGLVNERQKGL